MTIPLVLNVLVIPSPKRKLSSLLNLMSEKFYICMFIFEDAQTGQ